MTTRPRYYWTRDRATGKYKIVDRDIHGGMVIALADFREAAVAIVIALNELYEKDISSERTHSTPPADLPRTAVAGDLWPLDHPGTSSWHRLAASWS